ncbi:MAG: SUMF1/EgtB/PvdO family nonheme iron enzyme [Prevotellaceae bacterium]|jgi:formylglycine-generating enzyme required for sulfatase activity|nr:SUMF1/EgtB/PvdO family nonheme iron enzyme [Prevotellaceae bacterium]
MKKYLSLIALVIVFCACNKPKGELVGAGSKGGFKEANPYGMVHIKRGAFMMGQNDQSAISSVNNKPVTVTVDAFWMDKTEITNRQYKMFTNWVRDSLARRALVMSGMDEFRYNDRNQINADLPPETCLLNKKPKVPYNSNDDAVIEALNFLYYPAINGLFKKDFNPNALRYRYEQINYDQAALRKNKFNPNTGAYLPGASVRVDTAYIDENGVIHNVTITRPLRTRADLITQRIVNIYPDTMTWTRDFQYAYNDPKVKMYFSHVGFDNYPVVGVTWEQAAAFCHWRTQLFNSSHKITGQEYRLPTESEWEYAARGGHQGALYPWGGNYVRDNKGCFMANFKPMRGSYTIDEGATTMKVASFEPNNYGLYDMAGNVAEWTSSAFNPSSNTLINDMNANYQYAARNDDEDILKRKVVKGGSWKDIAYYLQCGTKIYEYQDEARPYIGFRCVRSYNGE